MNSREYQAAEKLRADRAMVTAAADRVRNGLSPLPDPDRYAGPLGELLDVLGPNLDRVDRPSGSTSCGSVGSCSATSWTSPERAGAGGAERRARSNALITWSDLSA
jgi:hypothetical protein